MKALQVELTLTEPMLGTVSANPELYEEFIAAKAPEANGAEELSTIPDVDEETQKSTTVFHRHEDQPFIYDYQIKGFFKDACGMLRRVEKTASKALKAYKKEIDGLIFPTPRQIMLNLPDGGEITICCRPLRVQDRVGERVCLARSEQVPAGTTMVFEVNCLRPGLEPLIEEWLDYGKLRGLGQWRNSGMGRFDYKFIE